MAKGPTPYTAEELVAMLKDRQGNLTQQAFAKEIGCSMQMLSQVYKGERSIGNEKILSYLAPKGSKFSHQDVWNLIKE